MNGGAAEPNPAALLGAQRLPGASKSAYGAAVEPRRLLDELFKVAKKLGLEVRVEPFSAPAPRVGAGGICRLRGRQVVLIDATAGMVDQAIAMAEALGRFELESVSMAPEARRIVESTRVRDRWRARVAMHAPRPGPGSRESSVRWLGRPKPGLRRTRPRGD